ncbi:MAG: winged helix-turn-helix domain-containing protein [Beijerinckiaceae bacterium]
MTYFFENYELDPARRELRRGPDRLTVEPQVFDLLHYLVENSERIVSKDDLIAGVWDGRIVSDSTLSSRITAVRQAIGDTGESQRLIRTVPRKGFRFVGSIQKSSSNAASSTTSSQSAALALPDRPSIAVLPFDNLSGDPEQEYFAEGMAEDIITALSQFRWLFVVARGSSFTFKGRAVDVKQVGNALGVRYVLEGSVRKAGKQVRITAQLVDTLTNAHLWADRFDGALENIFDLQDKVTANVVGAIAPKLEQAEIERAKRKPTDSLDAYDVYLRGVASAIAYTHEGDDEALRLFYRAIALDPEFAVAHGWAAWMYLNRKTAGRLGDRTQAIAEGTRLSRRAVELGHDDAAALCWGGFALAYLAHELDHGMTHLDRALTLNPNLSSAWYCRGWLRVYSGETEPAIDDFHRALRLSPLDPLIFRMQAGIAYAYFFAGQYEDAAAWADKAVRARPNWMTAVRGAAACHALAGRLPEAQRLMATMRQVDPALRRSNLNELLPLRRPQDFERWSDALGKAGLPA